MPTCFVMQPFDSAAFDRRFTEIFKPAIEAAGLEAYRVDQDPKTSIPIHDIEAGIRDAQVCLADITRDNPNVWFELGFAIACNKQVVLVCSDERESPRFPFDVQHRLIIRYPTKSPSDFTTLANNITEKLNAYIQKADTLAAVSEVSILRKFDGLDQHEVMALATVAQGLDHSEDHMGAGQIKRDMERGGFSKLATTIALRSLEGNGMIKGGWRETYQGDSYFGYELTELGWKWIIENKNKFALEMQKPKPKRATSFEALDDDIPF